MRAFLLWCLMACASYAQDFSGLARVDPISSSIRAERSTIVIDLKLSQTVPFRVFTVDTPQRLVIDFREVDWGELIAADLLRTDLVNDLRFGSFRPGWSRFVAELSQPYKVEEAGLVVDERTGQAELRVVLAETSLDDFQQSAGPPLDPEWATPAIVLETPVQKQGLPVIVVDPGHGGIDPGAERGGLKEANLMLSLGIELTDRLNRSGNVRAILTRDADYFVPLHQRITIARQANADLMISLHADALEEDQARGASVYTLSPEGEDNAARQMAERHERGDLLAGVDLSGQGDRVATVLMDLARLQTGPASDRFAQQLVQSLSENGARLNSRPRREGRLAVLTAADFSSVLVEVGFLSSARDREQLKTALGRAPIVAGLATAIERWVLEEAALKPLIRQ